MITYGISSGRTSARMLMDSVLAFDVGAAANKIFSKDIIYCGKDGNIACNKNNIYIMSYYSFSGVQPNVTCFWTYLQLTFD